MLCAAGLEKRAALQFANDEKKQPAVRPFVDGIEVLYVLDAPKVFRFPSRSGLETRGLSALLTLDYTPGFTLESR